MKAFNAIALSLFFLLCDVTAASSIRHTELTRRHSSIARRTSLTRNSLTRRASRCTPTLATSGVAAAVAAVTPSAPPSGGATINSTWECFGTSNGATTSINITDGPNGMESWLNCGINRSTGWSPPRVEIDQLVVADLAQSLKSKSSPFQACAPYLPLFEKYAAQVNLPAILFASFSLQESGCNPDTVGGGGEQGMMQLTQDKCGGAPNGNCRDPEYGIKTAAAFFAGMLKDDDNNILLSIGRYNGWHTGMTTQSATAAAHSSCCRCQNNLDYVHQFVNGWLVGFNPYKNKLGSIQNLAICPKVEQPS